MRRYARANIITPLLIATLAVLAGCKQRAGEQVAAPVESAPPAATAPPVSSPPPAPAEEPAPPEGVLRAYVWECDGGLTLNMKNLFRENAITLDMHEGPRKLSQVVSASGAKYSDGSITFWTKGGTATFERTGSAPVECRELRARSLVADARERGVLYRGTGNEPGWMVEIGPDGRITYVSMYGEERHDFTTVTERPGEASGVRVFVADTDKGPFTVTVASEACLDDMSGDAFDHRMLVEWGGETRRGCATAVQ
jgi:membrane-bound inhibitor of C-type lysozyme